MRTATTANEMARSAWPAAARARADRPNTAISTKSLPVSVSHDADFGATSFHQTKMAAPGAKAPMTIPSAILSPVWMPQYMRASRAHSSRRNRTVEFSAIQVSHRSLRQRIPPPCELTLWLPDRVTYQMCSASGTQGLPCRQEFGRADVSASSLLPMPTRAGRLRLSLPMRQGNGSI